MNLRSGAGLSDETQEKGHFMTTLTASLSDRPALPNTSDASPAPAAFSKKALWTGRVLSGFATLFLLFDGLFKFFLTPEAATGTADLGWPLAALRGLGVVELACLALYLIPRTAPIGALLWTGYLGGAIATHLRIGNPWLSHTLFPIYVAVFIWGGLFLRDRRVRALFAR
jgi:hypothetical protein